MRTFVIGDVHGRRAQLNRLLEMIPRVAGRDMLILLGDIIDRGEDVPGTVADVVKLHDEQPERVLCLRGNHEQMLLDFVDESATLWLHAAVGSECTFQQYTGKPLHVRSEGDFTTLRTDLIAAVPPAHIEFFRQLPLYHEDDYALYVHAGLRDGQRSPRTPKWTASARTTPSLSANSASTKRRARS
jgi:serine/threonine protein phosphatase 1